MKKDQNLPNKNSSQQQQFRKTTPEQYKFIQEINHHITQVIEEDHQNEETRIIHHKITTIDQIVEINYSRSNSNTQRFVSRSNSQSRK